MRTWGDSTWSHDTIQLEESCVVWPNQCANGSCDGWEFPIGTKCFCIAGFAEIIRHVLKDQGGWPPEKRCWLGRGGLLAGAPHPQGVGCRGSDRLLGWSWLEPKIWHKIQLVWIFATEKN